MRLLWLDITRREIHWFDPETRKDSAVTVETMVGAAVPREVGGLILAVEDGFAVLDDHGGFATIADVESDATGNRMNDGKCDSQGRFWAGTMDLKLQKPQAALYRLGVDRHVDTILSDITISNGLGWSPDDTLMYYIDSMTRRVDVFDYEPVDGTIGNRRTIVEIADDEGMPDGMTVDSDGFLWVAIYGAGTVRRFDPEGLPDMEIKLPVSNVTSCAFGGPDLRDVYITTAAQFMSDEELLMQPHAGGIYRARPGPTGMPAHRFRG
jgi:sugar lactone lactonase YvrE